MTGMWPRYISPGEKKGRNKFIAFGAHLNWIAQTMKNYLKEQDILRTWQKKMQKEARLRRVGVYNANVQCKCSKQCSLRVLHLFRGKVRSRQGRVKPCHPEGAIISSA